MWTRLNSPISRTGVRLLLRALIVFSFGDRAMSYDELRVRGLRELAMARHATVVDLREDDGVADDSLVLVGGLTNLVELRIGSWIKTVDVTDTGLEHLSKLPNLHVLELSSTRVTGKGLSHLNASTNLRSLLLSGSSLNDSAFGSLKCFPALEELTFGYSGPSETATQPLKVSEHGLNCLKDVPNLRHLQLSFVSVDGADLHVLSSLRRLERLELFQLRIEGNGIEQLGGSTSLRALAIEATPTRSDLLARIGSLQKLEELRLSRSSLSLEGLARLAQFSNLKRLSLSDQSQLTADGLANLLRSLNKLTHLELTRCGGVNDFVLRGLTGTHNLQRLCLRESEVTDEGLKYLTAAKSLRELDIAGSHRVTDKGLRHIEGLSELRRLDISGTEVSNDGLIIMKSLPNITELDLSWLKITDEALTHLTALRGLEILHLDGTQVTTNGLMLLGKSHPMLKVVYFQGGVWRSPDESDGTMIQTKPSATQPAKAARTESRTPTADNPSPFSRKDDNPLRSDVKNGRREE